MLQVWLTKKSPGSENTPLRSLTGPAEHTRAVILLTKKKRLFTRFHCRFIHFVKWPWVPFIKVKNKLLSHTKGKWETILPVSVHSTEQISLRWHQQTGSSAPEKEGKKIPNDFPSFTTQLYSVNEQTEQQWFNRQNHGYPLKPNKNFSTPTITNPSSLKLLIQSSGSSPHPNWSNLGSTILHGSNRRSGGVYRLQSDVVPAHTSRISLSIPYAPHQSKNFLGKLLPPETWLPKRPISSTEFKFSWSRSEVGEGRWNENQNLINLLITTQISQSRCGIYARGGVYVSVLCVCVRARVYK